MRALGFFVLALLLLLTALAFAFPNHLQSIDDVDKARLAYLLTLALFIGLGAFGMRCAGPPTSFLRRLLYLLVWIAAFVALMLAYQLYQNFILGLKALE